ncbi:VOC family protein [Novosphingobium sp. 9U]|uniref:VOC family protein n=1 Tax=Novosphingobium sp. 9U TaxID=2653158 RepID=UPI0012EFF8A2|nr:VOC family protein [Novosphingobium sp. 9U]VWX49973.1 conserved hypothetical protein [Novosphingobium sp. 9U]
MTSANPVQAGSEIGADAFSPSPMSDTDSQLRFMQLAINTNDLPGTLRLYHEAFGFANAGAQTAWGDLIRIQDLPPSARTLVWFMVGRQDFVQFEIFHHTVPAQRLLPADWRPCDLGWVRFGVSVPDLDRTIAALARWDVEILSGPIDLGRGRRLCFRDPFVGVMVEVMEESATLPGGVRHRRFDLEPAIIYVTSSVPDIRAARHFWETQVGLPILPLATLHAPEDEALWGLEGAEMEGFVAVAGDVLLEIVEYRTPSGRAKPTDYRLSDQGIVNIAVTTQDTSVVQAVIDRLDAEGRGPPRITSGPGILGTYVLDQGRELELLALPKAYETALGLVPGPDFLGAPSNPQNAMMLTER